MELLTVKNLPLTMLGIVVVIATWEFTKWFFKRIGWWDCAVEKKEREDANPEM